MPDGAKFYTFGLAAVCWAIWNCCNKATFEFKMPRSLFHVVFSACVFLEYWAGLLKGEDREAMVRGAWPLRDNAGTMMRISAAADDTAET